MKCLTIPVIFVCLLLTTPSTTLSQKKPEKLVYHRVGKWEGETNKSTKLITVRSKEWMVAWAAIETPDVVSSFFQIHVYDEDGNLIETLANAKKTSIDLSYFHNGPGKYYLKILSAGNEWRVFVNHKIPIDEKEKLLFAKLKSDGNKTIEEMRKLTEKTKELAAESEKMNLSKGDLSGIPKSDQEAILKLSKTRLETEKKILQNWSPAFDKLELLHKQNKAAKAAEKQKERIELVEKALETLDELKKMVSELNSDIFIKETCLKSIRKRLPTTDEK